VILVLTYHQVCSVETQRARGFYDVSRVALVAQIKATRQAGCRELNPREPLAGQTTQTTSQAGFLLTFDDGTADHYEIVFPVLQELGIHGVFFVPTAKLNRPGYLTDAQLGEMSKAGHAFGLHGHEHIRLDRASDEQMRLQFQRSHDILIRHTGRKPLFFAPVGGFMSEHLREVALGFGVEAIRTMRWGFNHQPDLTALETVPVNRHITELQFQRILGGEAPPRLLYWGKQVAKALVPARAYERLRGLVLEFAPKS
jgi:peptidoglycan/xylan/chitin deacetylase (PgdA/CDA1 family)